MHYTYILKCKDETYYTGYTNHLEKRIQAHNEGKGAKYTKGRGPVELVYFEEYEEKQPAMRREWEIKQMSRRQKEVLIQTGVKRSLIKIEEKKTEPENKENKNGNRKDKEKTEPEKRIKKTGSDKNKDKTIKKN